MLNEFFRTKYCSKNSCYWELWSKTMMGCVLGLNYKNIPIKYNNYLWLWVFLLYKISSYFWNNSFIVRILKRCNWYILCIFFFLTDKYSSLIILVFKHMLGWRLSVMPEHEVVSQMSFYKTCDFMKFKIIFILKIFKICIKLLLS